MSYNCGLLIYCGKIKLHVGLIRSNPISVTQLRVTGHSNDFSGVEFISKALFIYRILGLMFKFHRKTDERA